MAHNLRILNPPGEPTHRAGGVLDLVLSDDPGAYTLIAKDLHTTSDHETLHTTLTGGTPPPPPPGKLRLGDDSWNRTLFRTLIQYATTPVSDDPNAEA